MVLLFLKSFYGEAPEMVIVRNNVYDDDYLDDVLAILFYYDFFDIFIMLECPLRKTAKPHPKK